MSRNDFSFDMEKLRFVRGLWFEDITRMLADNEISDNSITAGFSGMITYRNGLLIENTGILVPWPG
jgi:hypothetical protein